MMERVLICLGSVVFLLCAGCSAPSPDDGRLTIAVSIAPQAFLVDELAGDLVSTVVMVPPGADPHSYEPSPEMMRAVAEADIYLAIGLPFEDQWLPRIHDSAPDLIVSRIDSGIVRTADQDPHIWMSPSLMQTMASRTSRILESADPANASSYSAGLERLEGEIDSVDAVVHGLLDTLEGSSFISLHPAYSYFAREYGLHQIAIEIEGSEPTPEQLSLIIEAARESGASVVIVSPGFSTGAAEALSIELGLPTAAHDQLARDWPASIISLAAIISGRN